MPTFSQSIEPLPESLTNNSVASLKHNNEYFIASFYGLAAGKSRIDIKSNAYLWSSQNKHWKRLPNLPGKGRLASTAAAIGDAFYIVGGYSVDEKGHEISTSEIYALSFPFKQYQLITHMPVAVDDALLSVYKERFLVLVSGWHDSGNSVRVQFYDVQQNLWSQATTFPGAPVFGHSGAIMGNQILVVDGVGVVGKNNGKRQFANISQAWLGTINPQFPTQIEWEKITNHLGLPRYRSAAIALPGKNKIVFIGGSENPYNYNGIGYDGVPSEPSSRLLIFDLDKKCWLNNTIQGPDIMDLRNITRVENNIMVVGGMRVAQKVSKQIHLFNINNLPTNLKCN